MILLQDVLADIQRLPTLPVSLARLSALARDECASVRDFEDALRPDAALTATILRLSNSAHFGYPGRITSVRHAVALLGNRRLMEVAAGGVLARLAPPVLLGYGIDAASFFRHSVAVATISQQAGMVLRFGDSEALFTCGLLHDIGKLVVGDYLARRSKALTQSMREARCTLIEAEKELLGLDHAEVGAVMAERWQLPAPVIAAVRWHHAPAEAMDGTVDLVHIADCLAHAMGFGADVGELARSLDPSALDRIGAPVGTLEGILAAAAPDITSLSAAFKQTPGGA